MGDEPTQGRGGRSRLERCSTSLTHIHSSHGLGPGSRFSDRVRQGSGIPDQVRDDGGAIRSRSALSGEADTRRADAWVRRSVASWFSDVKERWVIGSWGDAAMDRVCRTARQGGCRSDLGNSWLERFSIRSPHRQPDLIRGASPRIKSGVTEEGALKWSEHEYGGPE